MSAEDLFSSGTIRLFGAECAGLALRPEQMSGASPQQPLQKVLDKHLDPKLANICGFSYQGNYYKLSTPTVLLVHGPGDPVPASVNALPLDIAGVEVDDETFSPGTRMWAQDEVDFSVRIEITSGWLQEILLTAELGDDTNVAGGDWPEFVAPGELVGGYQPAGQERLVAADD